MPAPNNLFVEIFLFTLIARVLTSCFSQSSFNKILRYLRPQLSCAGVKDGGTINMRGFYGGMSSEHLVLIDGVPQNQGKDKLVLWDTIPIDNIERIEVMRGPASSLYGDNAMSGVINIITKKPSGTPHAGASFSYGTYTTQNYASYLSGTFNHLGYYLGVSSRLTNGFREHGDYENIQVYGKTDYSINDAQNLKFNFNYTAKTQGRTGLQDRTYKKTYRKTGRRLFFVE